MLCCDKYKKFTEYIYGKCQTATRIIKKIPLGVDSNIKLVAQIT